MNYRSQINLSRTLGSLTRATNHITPSSVHFTTYSTCSNNRKTIVGDCLISTVAGVGHVKLSLFLLLKNVLYILKLFSSLLSIYKLTSDVNYNALFYPSHCIFQDQILMKRIGVAKEKGCLYHLDASALHSPTVISLSLVYLFSIMMSFGITIFIFVILYLLF